MSDRWISAETEAKERDFRGILDMHVTICKGIMNRTQAPPYLYVDLFAGPGSLQYKGHRFSGSPLIAQETLTKAGIQYLAVHFERDPDVAARLAEELWVPTSLLDTPDEHVAPIHVESCQEGFAAWLDENGHDHNRYGLVYSDPIHDEIPYALLNKTAQHLTKVDLLSYVSATQYKRRRGVDANRPYLLDHVDAIGKRVVLIRRPMTAWHWTFVMWSNWPDFPAWEQHGFYRLDSDQGQRIMDQLNLSKREFHAKYNRPLWDETA